MFRTVYKKELKSLYRGLSGFAIAAVVLAAVAFGVLILNFNGADVRIGRMLNTILPFYVILAPLISMRAVAGEIESGTVRYIDAIRGDKSAYAAAKFAAVLTAFSAPFLLICLLPVVLGLYGDVNWISSYAAIFGFWLLGISLIAVGFLVSVYVGRSWMSAVMTFCLLTIDLLLPSVAAKLPDPIRTILRNCSVFYQYRYLSVEILDLRALALYLALAALCLLLACRGFAGRGMKKE